MEVKVNIRWLIFFIFFVCFACTFLLLYLLFFQTIPKGFLGISIVFGIFTLIFAYATYYFLHYLFNPVFLRLTDDEIEILRGVNRKIKYDDIQGVTSFVKTASEMGYEGIAIQLKNPSFISRKEKRKSLKLMSYCTLDSSKTKNFFPDVLVEFAFCKTPANEVVNYILSRISPDPLHKRQQQTDIVQDRLISRILTESKGFILGMLIILVMYLLTYWK